MLRALAGAPLGEHFPDEGAGALTHVHETLPFEIAIGLHHRGRVDPQPRRELSHRGQGLPWPQLAGCDRDPDAAGDLRIKRRGTSGIYLVEHRNPYCIVVTIHYYYWQLSSRGMSFPGTREEP